MKYKPIEMNLFKEFIDVISTTLMVICIPISILNLVISSNVGMTILHSLLLMYITSVLTVKVFAWRITKDVRGMHDV